MIINHHRAFSILKSDESTNVDLSTPVFKVHALHFAAAMLREDCPEAIGLEADNVSVTALGHTQLHVSCLPYRREEIHQAPQIAASIHDVRSLRSTQFTRHALEKAEFSETGERQHLLLSEKSESLRDVEVEKQKQENTCIRLVLSSGAGQVSVADIHGNTALHYLAASVFVSESLITWLRSQSGGKQVWQTSSNLWGHTPRDLWEEACSVRDTTPVTVMSKMAVVDGVVTMTGCWDPGLRGRW